MSEYVAFKARELAMTYVNIDNTSYLRDFRKKILEGLLINMMSEIEDDGLPIHSVFNNYQRRWIHFVDSADQILKIWIEAKKLDWDIKDIRSKTDDEQKRLINFWLNNMNKSNADKSWLLLLFAKVITIKHEDIETLIRKVDEIAYKWWKNEITTEEFLSIKSELTREDN